MIGAAIGDGEPLPACGPSRPPRWDLKALHAACNEARTGDGLTWGPAADFVYVARW